MVLLDKFFTLVKDKFTIISLKAVLSCSHKTIDDSLISSMYSSISILSISFICTILYLINHTLWRPIKQRCISFAVIFIACNKLFCSFLIKIEESKPCHNAMDINQDLIGDELSSNDSWFPNMISMNTCKISIFPSRFKAF